MRYAVYVIFILSLFIAPILFFFNSPKKNTITNEITIDSVFKDNQKIPVKFTCQGENVNPPLIFSNVPANAKSLVLIVSDPDSSPGNWIHWLVWDIDPGITQIEADTMSPDLRIGQNSWGKNEYNGPCPPAGTHRYIFRVYALDIVIGLIKDPTFDIINQQMAGHVLQQGQLTGLFN